MAVASAVAVDFGGGPGGFGMLPTGMPRFSFSSMSPLLRKT